MLVGIVLLLFSLGYVTCSVPHVSCTVMNLEYIDCTWNETGLPQFNYTFYSRLRSKIRKKCPTYLLDGVHTVGCRLPYANGDKFENLSTYLSLDNSSETEQRISLQSRVKLRPPHNLSLQMQGRSELWLYWNVSAPSVCVGSEVSYRKDTDTEVKMTGELPGKSFSLPFPSQNNRYSFQVRTRVMESCFPSNWSAWSAPVYWGQIKQSNNTSPEVYNGNSMDWLGYTLAAVLFVVVIAALYLVFQNERLRVILIPIVPNPSRTVNELIYAYNGNVEESLHIPKDFVEGFKPNFSELACPVREYKLIPQKSINGSAGSLPALLDESDCLDTSCSTSTSSLLSPLGDTPPGLV